MATFAQMATVGLGGVALSELFSRRWYGISSDENQKATPKERVVPLVAGFGSATLLYLAWDNRL